MGFAGLQNCDSCRKWVIRPTSMYVLAITAAYISTRALVLHRHRNRSCAASARDWDGTRRTRKRRASCAPHASACGPRALNTHNYGLGALEPSCPQPLHWRRAEAPPLQPAWRGVRRGGQSSCLLQPSTAVRPRRLPRRLSRSSRLWGHARRTTNIRQGSREVGKAAEPAGAQQGRGAAGPSARGWQRGRCAVRSMCAEATIACGLRRHFWGVWRAP